MYLVFACCIVVNVVGMSYTQGTNFGPYGESQPPVSQVAAMSLQSNTGLQHLADAFNILWQPTTTQWACMVIIQWVCPPNSYHLTNNIRSTCLITTPADDVWTDVFCIGVGTCFAVGGGNLKNSHFQKSSTPIY